MTVLNYIEPQVDIYVFPSIHPILRARLGDEIVIGDLHANTIKLIYFLIRHGVIHGMTAEQYQQIVTICCKPAYELVKEDLDRFIAILKSLLYYPGATVSLVGDDLADRTDSCDVFTMLVIKYLRDYKVPIKIHLSNHTSQMIEACELKSSFDSALLVQQDCLSMHGLHSIIQNQLMSYQDIVDLYNQGYKKALRACSHFSDTHPDGKTIVYMISHAGTDLLTVRGASEYLMTDTRLSDTPKARLNNFTDTTEAIDKTFRAVVEGNLIHQLYDSFVVGKAYQGPFNLRSFPFEEIMWNRMTEHLDRSEEQEDFYIRFIHGHHIADTGETNVCNLDNTLGKSAENHVGEYSIVFKTNHDLPPVFIDEHQFNSGTRVRSAREARASYQRRLFSDVLMVDSKGISPATSSTQTPIPASLTTTYHLRARSSLFSETSDLDRQSWPRARSEESLSKASHFRDPASKGF